MIRKILASMMSIAAVATLAGAAEIVSGPQVGDKLPGPFTPLNVTGNHPGEKNCLYCENGDKPVVMIFARNADCPMTQKLIKQVDATVAKNEKCEMGSFVVFCTDDSSTETKLKSMAGKENIKKVVLSIEGPNGPAKYKFAKDADVTVVLYVNRTVKANHSYKAGEMKDGDIETILKDVKKITPDAGK